MYTQPAKKSDDARNELLLANTGLGLSTTPSEVRREKQYILVSINSPSVIACLSAARRTCSGEGGRGGFILLKTFFPFFPFLLGALVSCSNEEREDIAWRLTRTGKRGLNLCSSLRFNTRENMTKWWTASASHLTCVCT